MLQIGFSTEVLYKLYGSPIARLEEIADISYKVLEIHLSTEHYLSSKRFITDLPAYKNLTKHYDYVSIHSPYLSDITDSTALNRILELAKTISAQTVLFHPDLFTNYSQLNRTFGSLLAFENLDFRKSFGNSVQDLEQVFGQCPQAGFVCDVNHIGEMGMNSAQIQDFHKAFGHRLRHYHVSSNPPVLIHGTYSEFPKSIDNLDAVLQSDIPIIHEGVVKDLKSPLHELLRHEVGLISKCLHRNLSIETINQLLVES